MGSKTGFADSKTTFFPLVLVCLVPKASAEVRKPPPQCFLGGPELSGSINEIDHRWLSQASLRPGFGQVTLSRRKTNFAPSPGWSVSTSCPSREPIFLVARKRKTTPPIAVLMGNVKSASFPGWFFPSRAKLLERDQVHEAPPQVTHAWYSLLVKKSSRPIPTFFLYKMFPGGGYFLGKVNQVVPSSAPPLAESRGMRLLAQTAIMRPAQRVPPRRCLSASPGVSPAKPAFRGQGASSGSVCFFFCAAC